MGYPQDSFVAQMQAQDGKFREWQQRIYDATDPGGRHPKYKPWKEFLRNRWDQLAAEYNELHNKYGDEKLARAWDDVGGGFWKRMFGLMDQAYELGYPKNWDEHTTTSGVGMDPQDIETFGRQLCNLTLNQDGEKLYLVASCNLCQPDGTCTVYQRSVEIGPILSWVEGKLRDIHSRWHQATAVSGLSDLYRAAVTTARQFAQSQLFRELATDVTPVLVPGTRLTFEETKKSSEVVDAAKKGDPKARTAIHIIRTHAELGDTKAKTTINTMKVLSDMQDQKKEGSDMSLHGLYNEGLHGSHTSVGHSPVAWVGTDVYKDGSGTVRDHRKGASKGSAENWFHNVSTKAKMPVHVQARPPAAPGAVPPGYPPAGYPPGYPPPGYPPGYPGYDPYAGLGMYPGLPGFDPGAYDPYGGFGPQGIDPLTQALLMQEMAQDPVVNQSTARVYDPATDSFYSNQVNQQYDPNTDSFSPQLLANPYSATGFTDPYAMLDPRIMGWAHKHHRPVQRPTPGPKSLKDFYRSGL